jgi:hypothetical protein
MNIMLGSCPAYADRDPVNVGLLLDCLAGTGPIFDKKP